MFSRPTRHSRARQINLVPGDLDSISAIAFTNGLTFYADGLTEHDTISPIVDPTSQHGSGASIFPDFRNFRRWTSGRRGFIPIHQSAEMSAPGFFTTTLHGSPGFANAGNLMGHWVGREGQGVQAWTSYWLSPRNKLQFEFRHLKVSHEFITNGGTLTDASVRADFWAQSTFSLSAAVQYETWTFPVIASTRQSNVTSSVQLTFWPKGPSRRGPE